MTPCLRILGCRGVPANHGGFETFAERLALHLVSQGWRVVVYCQQDGQGPVTHDRWQGVERVNIPAANDGPRATMLFDWKATMHAARHDDLCITMGYNTAVFAALLRAARVPNVFSMDGIEWSRAKWGLLPRAWLRMNETAACWLGNRLVADHPEIAVHLRRHGCDDRLSAIPLGADRITEAPEDAVHAMGLVPGRYLTVVARAEPENSILEIVQAFSRRSRALTLAVLGNYDDSSPFQRAVRAAAGPQVRFLGPVYDRARLSALRFHCTAYIHGHQVGGTNPSLVEALGAGNAVIAHDNRFNRWVAGDGARYFKDVDSLEAAMNQLLDQPAALAAMRAASIRRFEGGLSWADVLVQYERLLRTCLPARVNQAAAEASAARPR